MSGPDVRALRAVFDEPSPLTVGVEEELMLLDADTLDLTPRVPELLERLDGDLRFKPELPAAQVELITQPAGSVEKMTAELTVGRADLAQAAAGIGVLAGAGTHPFASATGALTEDPRYEFTRREYGPVAERQLVFGLHVHVRIEGADRAVAVYDSFRSHLPELAALAANAPYLDDRDTGFASVRPKLSELLPRQGVPPAIGTLEQLAAALAFGASSGMFPEPRLWWWELRLHPVLGTLEVRVPDQQTTPGETAALAAVVHCLVAELASRHDSEGALPVHPSWKIAENRWSAARHGLAGTLADLDTGEPAPTRERVLHLIDSVAARAAELGCSSELEDARALAAENGAERQRVVANGSDLRAVTAMLAERFVPGGGL